MMPLNHDLIFISLSKELQQRSEIIILPEIDSTHSFLDQLLISDCSRVVVCTTENQTAGKGRLDRVWSSSAGEDLCLSLAFFMPIKPEQLMGLSLIVGIALCRAIKTTNISGKILIKWPNDLIYQDQKLAGILVQHQQVAENLQKVIISVGMNVNSQRDGLASLKQILAKESDRNALIANIVSHIYRATFDFAAGGMVNFQAEWHNLDYLYNKTITIAQEDKIYPGTVKGIDLQGQVIIVNDQGEERAFSYLDSLIVKK